jgi:hypothetical protein
MLMLLASDHNLRIALAYVMAKAVEVLVEVDSGLGLKMWIFK